MMEKNDKKEGVETPVNLWGDGSNPENAWGDGTDPANIWGGDENGQED